jgi:hypothetical protein
VNIDLLVFNMYMQVTQKPKIKPAAPLFELGLLSQADPTGRTVKASINAMAIEKGTHKNQYGTVL